MRTGKDLILATKQYASDVPARSWWYILSTAALLAAALVGAVCDFNFFAELGFGVLAGLLILRLFVVYHDQQHHAILAHSKLAEALMRGFGIFSISPSSIWRSSHNYHHKHNSKLRSAHIGSFPIMTRDEYLRSSRAVRFRYLFMRHPLTILFGYVSAFLYGMCLYPFLTKPRQHFDCLIAFLLHVGLGVILVRFCGWSDLVTVLIVPFFVAGGVGTYLFYAQHNFPDVVFSDRAGWAYEKAALESSSYMKMNPVMTWFTANIGYHHIHHLNARIPFYRLPEVKAAMPELATPKTTSLHPREIFRCLRLKVWDVEAQRMISLRECHAQTTRKPGIAAPSDS